MNLLLVHENTKVRELLSFQLSAKFKLTVREASTQEDAAEILKKISANRQAYDILAKANANDRATQLLKSESAMEFIIAPFTADNTALMHSIKAFTPPIASIFYYDKKQPTTQELIGIECIGTAKYNNLADDVEKILADFFAQNPLENPEAYCPIRTTLLIKATPLKSDIYIRLSPEKFLKLFPKNSDFGAEDLHKYYETKKVEYMYIRSDETEEFANRLQEELDSLLSDPNISAEKLEEAVTNTQDALQALVSKVGFTEAVQEVAKKNVELSLKSIGKQPRLSAILERVRSGENYLPQHCTLLSHICCCIAEEMKWTSDNTFNKLVLASLLHDIAIHNPELAKINTKEELEKNKAKFTPEEVKSYIHHPSKAADVVKSFKEIPPDVDNIVAQHHERPNGSGFPRGLTHNYIAPLSALFIIAHDITQCILMEPDGRFSLGDFVQRKKINYHQGNFKKIVSVLEKVKLN